MEASGGYERLTHRHLLERGLAVAIVNAKRVRDLAKASGRLAKLVLGPAQPDPGDRPSRCCGDRPLRRVRPAAGDAGAGRCWARALARCWLSANVWSARSPPGSSSWSPSRRPRCGHARKPISPGCAAQKRGDAAVERLVDLLRADVVDVAVEAAGRDDLALARDRLGRRADHDVDVRLGVGIAGFADAGDAAVADADVRLDDAPVIEDQRVGDHRVDHALAARVCDCPLPSRITLPPPNLTSSP